MLEAVPVGAISHILAGAAGSGVLDAPEVSRADELIATIKEVVEQGLWPSVCVFSISNLDELLKDRGTGTLIMPSRNFTELFATGIPSAAVLDRFKRLRSLW